MTVLLKSMLVEFAFAPLFLPMMAP